MQLPQQHVRAMDVAHMNGLLHIWTDCHVDGVKSQHVCVHSCEQEADLKNPSATHAAP